MDFAPWAAVVAGLSGTVVMSVVMYVVRSDGVRTDLPRMLGLMFFREEQRGAVYASGMSFHLLIGALFGLAYAAVFQWLPFWGLLSAGMVWGAILGVAHALIAATALAAAPALHPRVGQQGRFAAPGFFGHRYGATVPLSLCLLHIVFGASFGVIYALLVG